MPSLLYQYNKFHRLCINLVVYLPNDIISNLFPTNMTPNKIYGKNFPVHKQV